MPYVHAWEKDGVYRRFYGTLSANDLLDSSQRLASDARFRELEYDLVDYSQVRRYDVSPGALARQALRASRADRAPADIPVALVAADRDLLRALRDLRMDGEPMGSFEIFARVADARQWIGKRLAARAQEDGDGVASSVTKTL